MSKLYFRYGAMNSGKSTALLQVAHNYEERGMKVVLLKPATDKKGGNTVVSRLGVARQVDFMVDAKDDLISTIGKHKQNHTMDCILVDEVQFFHKEHVDELLVVGEVGQDALDRDDPLEALHADLLGQEQLGHAAGGDLS